MRDLFTREQREGWTKMGEMRGMRTGSFALLAAFLCAAMAAAAMQEIPKESAKALGVTRGRSFSSGVVFVEGKYLPPPYVVERWGTGIRINSIPVTGQIVPWNDFLKTQTGVKVTKTEIPPAPKKQSYEMDDFSLDDLFDDDPKPSKKRKANRKPVAPSYSTSYSLDGEFVKNEVSKSMVARVNAVRTEIDRILRIGGFICFGEKYSRISGDSNSALALLEKLPGLMRSSATLSDFKSAVRAAGLVYLPEVICEEIYRNRIDYPKLQERYEKIKGDMEIQRMINEAAQPLL